MPVKSTIDETRGLRIEKYALVPKRWSGMKREVMSEVITRLLYAEKVRSLVCSRQGIEVEVIDVAGDLHDYHQEALEEFVDAVIREVEDLPERGKLYARAVRAELEQCARMLNRALSEEPEDV